MAVTRTRPPVLRPLTPTSPGVRRPVACPRLRIWLPLPLEAGRHKKPRALYVSRRPVHNHERVPLQSRKFIVARGALWYSKAVKTSRYRAQIPE